MQERSEKGKREELKYAKCKTRGKIEVKVKIKTNDVLIHMKDFKRNNDDMHDFIHDISGSNFLLESASEKTASKMNNLIGQTNQTMKKADPKDKGVVSLIFSVTPKKTKIESFSSSRLEKAEDKNIILSYFIPMVPLNQGKLRRWLMYTINQMYMASLLLLQRQNI
ncbi:unnamed protein product [Sphenostylis stenocarpa]|uniref:Uncharacterized protein n=1 Tax=Sphenostylis stenocarpa TaxID=92480 RepID=A0AA86SR64_9FABA|nr:unnamed protein product [Sphenostylis stenocarpa]